ncbi:MAG TPA: nitrous oxide reductase accessory protein NosL [Geomonas sp.]|nr:nitrous oxide reductase accessory protein NosL [Geomonas sp.]
MILVDKRFGAELVAKRVYKFDGLDELARFQAAHPEQRGTAYVTDGESGKLLAAGGATFLASPELRGPMGGNVIAFGQRQAAERFAAEHHLQGARYLAFPEALKESGGGADAGR